MKQRFTTVAALTLMTGWILSAPAHGFVSSHSCSKPDPYGIRSSLSASLFESEVERYKACIEDFVDDQKREIEKHRRAAQEAVDEWNRFISDLQ